MILFIIIIVIIVFFFTREEKFKCYVSDKTIKKKSIKSSNIGKVEDNYCMWNNNKCRLPNYSQCKRDSNCISNNCVNGYCLEETNCGMVNYKYIGSNIEKKDTLSASQCNEICNRNNKCNYWTWNRKLNKCNLKGNIVSSEKAKNNISGIKNSCNGGNITCSACFQLNDNCNTKKGAKLCSYDNKLIKTTTRSDMTNYISYLNTGNNSEGNIGKINCRWGSPPIKNVSLEKCLEIANGYRTAGRPVAGVTIKYPEIKSNKGWCGPDSEVLQPGDNQQEGEYQKIQTNNKKINRSWLNKGYIMKQFNIMKGSDGNLVIKTNLNPSGIKISKNKASNFENISEICISGKPITPYSDIQKIIARSSSGGSLYIKTALNPGGIRISSSKTYLFDGSNIVYISPSFNVKKVNKYPDCIVECKKNLDCSGVRWVKSTNHCDLMKSCSKYNNDKRWRYWQKNLNNVNNILEWKYHGKGQPNDKYKIKELDDNDSLEYCQLICKNTSYPNKCKMISYRTEDGKCILYKDNNGTLGGTDNMETYKYNRLYGF